MACNLQKCHCLLKNKVERVGGKTWQVSVILNPWQKLHPKVVNGRKELATKNIFRQLRKFDMDYILDDIIVSLLYFVNTKYRKMSLVLGDTYWRI